MLIGGCGTSGMDVRDLGGLHGAFLVGATLKGTALAALPLWGGPGARPCWRADPGLLNVTWIFFGPGAGHGPGLAGSLFRPLGRGQHPA